MRCVAKLAVAVMCAGLTSIGAAPGGGEQEPAGWSEAQVLYTLPAGSRTVALDGRVAVCGETVHAVWNHDDRIFWSCSRDDGTWTTPEVLSERSTLVSTPDLAASGSEVHLVWDEFFHVKYRRFDGSQWGPAETLPCGTDSVVHPCVAIVEGTPWVIWKRYEPALLPDAGGGTSRLRYSFRSSSGWRGPWSVPGSADVEEFAAATDGTDLYVAWTARPNALLWQKLGAGPRGEQRYVLASACETGLRRWQEPQRLAELKGELGREVRVAARDGLAGVLWMDGFRTGDVQVSLRSGGTWQEPRRFAVPVSGDGTIDGELVGTLTHGLVLLASPADGATGDVLLVTRLGTNSELAFRWPADPRFTRLSLRAACSPESLLYVISGQGAIRLRTIELPGPRY